MGVFDDVGVGVFEGVGVGDTATSVAEMVSVKLGLPHVVPPAPPQF